MSRLRHLAITIQVPTVDGRLASGVPASSTSLAVHSCVSRLSSPTPTGNSRLGAMTPGRRIIDCGRHAGGGRRLRSLRRVPSWCIWRAGVGGPVAGEDGGAHLERRRPPGDRRRAETGPTSIIWTAPLPAPSFSNSSTDQRPVGPHLSVWRPRHLAAAPRCKASRCCASVGIGNSLTDISTEVVENGRGYGRRLANIPAGALLPAAPTPSSVNFRLSGVRNRLTGRISAGSPRSTVRAGLLRVRPCLRSVRRELPLCLPAHLDGTGDPERLL